jgi:hypothetical protein
MEINSHILKMLGKSELPSAIQIGHNYEVIAKGSITKEELHDNEDGTGDKIYTFKPITVELKTELGESLKLKDPRRNSEKFRAYLYKLWRDEGILMDFDTCYEKVTLKAMADMPRLLREVIQEL